MPASVQYDFSGAVAMVSGGSRGIGLATARAFAGAGASVAIAARTQEDVEVAARDLEELAAQAGSGGGGLGVVADLTEAPGVRRFVDQTVERFGGVDILVNSAGGSEPAPFLELTDEQLVGGWTLKLLSAIRLTRAVAPLMEARGGGAVVSIGGGTANFSPDRITAATTISAMRAFTKAVAPDLAKRGINVNIIHPGSVSTGRQRLLAEYNARRRGVSVEQVMEEQAAAVPTGRVTTPEEVAVLALFLTSRTVFNLTGAEVVLDGGVSRAL